MARRERGRKWPRQAAVHASRPIVLLVCEGTVTEPQYFQGLANSCRNPRVQIEISPRRGVPKTLVEIAKQLKNDSQTRAEKTRDRNLAYDSVWCVFDIDDHPNLPDAKQMARDNGIDLAISNPCIELWLLLHFREHPGMKHRIEVKAMMKDYILNYEKAVDFRDYAHGCDQAIVRARRMDKAAVEEGEPGRNPTTGVHALVAMIRE